MFGISKFEWKWAENFVDSSQKVESMEIQVPQQSSKHIQQHTSQIIALIYWRSCPLLSHWAGRTHIRHFYSKKMRTLCQSVKVVIMIKTACHLCNTLAPYRNQDLHKTGYNIWPNEPIVLFAHHHHTTTTINSITSE